MAKHTIDRRHLLAATTAPLLSLLSLLACNPDSPAAAHADGGAPNSKDGSVATGKDASPEAGTGAPDASTPDASTPDAGAPDGSAVPSSCAPDPKPGPKPRPAPELVTRSTADGLPASQYNSAHPDTTPDGRFVVFESSETGLVTPATNGVSQIFLRDRKLRTTQLVSVGSSGQGDRDSNGPTISDDGCRVAFHSLASNLAGAAGSDASAGTRVLLRDLCTSPPETRLVSVDAAGVALPHGSRAADISGDGAWIAFESDDALGTGNIYLYDVAKKKSLEIAHGDFSSRVPAISADGKRVAFWSYASDLAPGDTNGMWDILLYDAATAAISLVSSDAAGVQQTKGAEGISTVAEPAISGDGRYVAFRSRTASLLPGTTGGFSQVYVKDTKTGALVRASQSSAGMLGNGDSSGSGEGLRPSLSFDGTWVAFVTAATNLAPETASQASNLVVHDIGTGKTVGIPGATGDQPPVISGDVDGRFVVAYSTAHLDPSFDTAGVFLFDRNTPAVAIVAQAALSARVGDTVTLDGSGSNDPDDFRPGGLTLTWSQICGPAVASLSDPHGKKPTFVPTAAGVYAFELVANDGLTDSSHVRVTVTVN